MSDYLKNLSSEELLALIEGSGLDFDPSTRILTRVRDSGGELFHAQASQDIAEKLQAGRQPEQGEQRFRDLTMLSSDWYWEQDENLRFTLFAGDYFDRVLSRQENNIGLTRWEVKGMEVDPAQKAAHQATLDACEPFHDFEYRRRFPDGSLHWLSVSGMPLFDAGGRFKGYRGIVRDISARKAVEDSLRESEQRFRDLTALSADWYWEQDEHYRFREISGDAFGRMPAPYVLTVGNPRWELPGVDASGADWAAHRAAVQAHRPFTEFVYGRRFDDGSMRYISVSGMPLFDAAGQFRGYRGVGRDVTRQKAAEQALRESEQRFRDLTELSADWFWEQDKDLRFTLMTNQVSEHVAVDTHNVVGKTRFELPNEFESEQARRQHQADLDARRPFRDLVVRQMARDNAWRYASISGVPMFDANGNFTGYRGVGRDITTRKMAEQALRESEARYRAAFEQVGVGMAEIAPDGQWLRVNHRLARLFGYEPAELVAIPWQQVNHPDDIDAAVAKLRALMAGGPQTYSREKRYLRRDGSTWWAQISLSPVRDDSGGVSYLLATIEDITARKEAEAAREASENLLRLIFERAPVGIAMLRLDGTWAWINDRLCGILGYSEDDLLGRNFAEVTFAEDLVADQENMALFRAGMQDLRRTSKRYIARDGRIVWCDLSVNLLRDPEGAPWRLIASVVDITEQMAAEAANSRFRAAIETSAEGIYLFDYETTRYVDMNETGCRMLDYTREELLGMCPRDIDPAISDEQRRTGWARLMEIAPEVETIQSVHRRRDGREYPVEITRRAVRSSERPLIVSVVRDISDRKKHEQAMRQLNEELEQRVALRTTELLAAKEEADRASRAKSEFLSRMSHELRTPMNAILGFAQLMESDSEHALNEVQIDNLREILKAARHLLDLINEVLDLSRVEEGRIELAIEPVECAGVAEECLKLVGPQAATAGIRLVCSGLAGVRVRADRLRLKQVLLNLLSNAIKYNRPGGEVELSAAAGQPQACIRLAVRDTGPGIASERLGDLFQPFSRLGAENTAIEGTGIGLAITRRLVEMMGGRVGVDSEKGAGSCFWVELPAVALAGPEAQAATVAETPYATVLYIDDNATNLKLVGQILRKRPHVKLHCVRDAVAGLDLVRTHGADLILLDVNLPGVDGYEFMRRLGCLEGVTAIPVIAVTENPDHGGGQGGAAGFAGRLAKPIDVQHLLAVVDRTLAVARANGSDEAKRGA